MLDYDPEKHMSSSELWRKIKEEKEKTEYCDPIFQEYKQRRNVFGKFLESQKEEPI